MSAFENIKSLPAEIPIFPLNGVLLLPNGVLPLNIFETRYVSMIDDALKADRLIGMIQPRDKSANVLFDVGCVGRITAFEENEAGHYQVQLTGISRFKLEAELALHNGYRRARINLQEFEADITPQPCLDLNREELKTLLGNYFDLHEISCDWEAIDDTPDGKLITCLSMICPFDANEKQALLEAQCCRTRARIFMTMLEIAVRDDSVCGGGCH